MQITQSKKAFDSAYLKILLITHLKSVYFPKVKKASHKQVFWISNPGCGRNWTEVTGSCHARAAEIDGKCIFKTCQNTGSVRLVKGRTPLPPATKKVPLDKY